MLESRSLRLLFLHNFLKSRSSKSFASPRACSTRRFHTFVCGNNIRHEANKKSDNTSSTHAKHHCTHTPYSLDLHHFRDTPFGALGNARTHSTHGGNVPAGNQSTGSLLYHHWTPPLTPVVPTQTAHPTSRRNLFLCPSTAALTFFRSSICLSC
jgi:hypothetical protein